MPGWSRNDKKGPLQIADVTLPRLVCIFIILASFVCYSSGLAQSLSPVYVADVPIARSFQMPVGRTAAANLNFLTIGSFTNFVYPKIRFNENDNHLVDTNEWYVATAFNQNRWLNNGWDTEPSTTKLSMYSNRGDYHPGEDWNLNTGEDTDRFDIIYAIANGVVLFNGCVDNYGNTIIIAHRLQTGEIITSFYGHMEAPSTFQKGAEIDIGDVIGNIGKTNTSKCAVDKKFPAHLHFEIRRQSMIQIDPITSEVRLAYAASMWPATSQDVNGDNGKGFIASHYYPPSEFLLGNNGQVIFSNFGPGDSYFFPGGWGVSSPGPHISYSSMAGESFVSAANFRVTTIEISMSVAQGAETYSPREVNVSLMTDQSGAPGTVIEVFHFTNLGISDTAHPPLLMSSTAHPTLLSGTKYWLVASGVLPDTNLAWHEANSIGSHACSSTLTGNCIGTQIGTWLIHSDFQGAFRVSGISIQ